jgi:hypothetical protein
MSGWEIAAWLYGAAVVAWLVWALGLLWTANAFSSIAATDDEVEILFLTVGVLAAIPLISIVLLVLSS